jgi:hypothetical protein
MYLPTPFPIIRSGRHWIIRINVDQRGSSWIIMDHHRPTWICADPTLMVVASSLSCLHRAMKVVVFRVGAGFLTEALDHAAPTYKGDTVHGVAIIPCWRRCWAKAEVATRTSRPGSICPACTGRMFCWGQKSWPWSCARAMSNHGWHISPCDVI